jgi:hypothetical protein
VIGIVVVKLKQVIENLAKNYYSKEYKKGVVVLVGCNMVLTPKNEKKYVQKIYLT